MADCILGIVINPKLKKPCVVVADDSKAVRIELMEGEIWPVIGSGYYGSEGDDEASRLSGYPRSHTPRGVAQELRGQGYGTCLYTALCLGAHSNFEHHNGERQRWAISRYGGDTGDGISSSPDRSEDADAWWDSAKRMGLARQHDFDDEEEDVDLTFDASSSLVGEDIGDSKHISRITECRGDITKTVEVDVYPWGKAFGAKLIVAEMDGVFEVPDGKPELAWKLLQGPETEGLVVNVEPEWILACDVRGLSVDGINLLGVLAQVAGVPESELAGFRLRWELGLDPEEEMRQLPLSLTKNASRARAAYRALETAQDLRQKTGWQRLAALP